MIHATCLHKQSAPHGSSLDTGSTAHHTCVQLTQQCEQQSSILQMTTIFLGKAVWHPMTGKVSEHSNAENKLQDMLW